MRAPVAQAGAAIRADCAHSSGLVWAINAPGYRSSDAALCCARSPASVCTSVANCCNLRAGCCRTVCMGWCKTRGKVHRSFEIHSAWSVSTAVRTVLLKDAHQMHAAVDPGCNESVRRMCEHPNLGRVLVATEVTALWRRSGDRRALRTLELLAMELRTKDSGLSVGREETR